MAAYEANGCDSDGGESVTSTTWEWRKIWADNCETLLRNAGVNGLIGSGDEVSLTLKPFGRFSHWF